MSSKSRQSEDGAASPVQDGRRGLSLPGVAVTLGLMLAVFGLWVVTASAEPNEWFFFDRYSNSVFIFNLACTYLTLVCGYVLAKRGAVKERAFNAVLHLGALFAILVFIELPAATGLFDYRTLLVPKMIGGQGPHNKVLGDGLYWHRPPHDEFRNALPGDTALRLALPDSPIYEAAHRYDRNGYRNDRDLEQADIVLIGDSFLEGYKVTQSELLSNKLADMMGEEVANLSQAGYGPQNELQVLRDMGLGLEPKVVVWVFFEGNDVIDYDEERRTWSKHESDWRARSLVVNLLKALNRWTLSLMPSEDRKTRVAQAQVPASTDGVTARMFFEEMPPNNLEAAASNFEQAKAFIGEARDLAEGAGSRFILAYAPTKINVYKNLADIVTPEGMTLELASFAPGLEQWSREAGIEYLDLTPALLEDARSGNLTYFLDDEHWTPLGHTIVAKEIAGAIRRRPN